MSDEASPEQEGQEGTATMVPIPDEATAASISPNWANSAVARALAKRREQDD